MLMLNLCKIQNSLGNLLKAYTYKNKTAEAALFIKILIHFFLKNFAVAVLLIEQISRKRMCLLKLFFKIRIYLRTAEYNRHAHIQPQHHQHNGGQTSVHVGE